MEALGSTQDNLQTAISGETYEVEEMYPAFQKVAELQNEKSALHSTTWALEAEKIHAEMYEKAREAVLSGKDTRIGEIYICEICGWTVEGAAPDRCPICGASKDKFKMF